jgi:hypothetical protein
MEVLKASSVVQTLSSSTENDGTFSWTIPSTLAMGTDYRIRITSTTHPAITDSSNAYFTITSGTTTPSITVTSPNGGESWQRGTSHNVTWSFTGSPGSTVNIALFKGSTLITYIASSYPIGSGGVGYSTWQIPPGLATGSDYKVGIESASNTNINDYSDNPFTISSGTTTPSITVTSPNGGESWQRGSSHNVTWSFTGSPGSTVKIVLINAGFEVRTLTDSTSIGSGGKGSYTWSIDPSGTFGSEHMISVQSTSQSSIKDTSDNSFTITSGTTTPSITVTAPNGGESWIQGSTHAITWTSSGDVGSNVKMEVLKASSVVQTLSSSTENDGTFSWTIPTTLTTGTDYRIRITSTTHPAITDTSNAYFTITSGTTGSIIVTSPNGGESWVRGSNHAITWTSSGTVGSYVKIEVLKASSVVQTLSSSTENDGTFSWTIPSTIATGTDYRIRITSTTHPAITDSSNAYFTITSGVPITVTSPNGGENWKRGTNHTVTWTYTGSPGSRVNLALFKGGSLITYFAKNYPIGSGGAGSYSDRIPPGLTPGSDYKVGIEIASNMNINDFSDKFFTISL